MTDIGYTIIHTAAESGDWYTILKEIREDRNAVFECNPSGKTALHVAVIAGQERIVENLVKSKEVDERLLTMQDKDGYTALAFVAQLNDNTRMARCMVEKNQDLLTMETIDHQIPLVLASARGHKQLTRYLYSLTPEDVLSKNNSSHALMLLLNCISAQIFGKISSSSSFFFLFFPGILRFSSIMLDAVTYH